MILLLGATGYMGQAFATELRRRGYNFIPLTRQAFDYTNFDLLFDYVRKMRPEFIINAAGYVGKPNEETCELEHGETLFANTFLPQTIEKVCSMTNTPWGHVSSGNIYCGAKVFQNREKRIVRDLQQSEIQELHASHPEMFLGFTEWDEPNSTAVAKRWLKSPSGTINKPISGGLPSRSMNGMNVATSFRGSNDTPGFATAFTHFLIWKIL